MANDCITSSHKEHYKDTTFSSEFYQTSFQDLVQLLGEEKALKKVEMYQSPPYREVDIVKNGLLLQSYQNRNNFLANVPISVFYDKVNGKQLGIKNTRVKKDLPLLDVVKLIEANTFKKRTATLRSIDKKMFSEENKLYKQSYFSYACFSGTFSYRSDASLIQHSKLICIDLDNLAQPDHIIRIIAEQADKEHIVLCFISPNGDGVKVLFYADDLCPDNQYSYYGAFSSYLAELCQIPVQSIDKSCKDVSRACFLPYDPNIWVNELLPYKTSY